MTVMRIRRLQNALTSVYYMKKSFESAWPELLGNQPEYSELLCRIQKDIDTLVDIANRKMTTAEYEINGIVE